MSGDISRLEEQAEKLVHPLPKARLAAAKSILFKLQSGLFGDISRSVSCVRILNDRMVESLSLVLATEDWKENGNTDADVLIALCNLFQKIATTFNGSAYASGGDFSKALGMLQKIASVHTSGIVEKVRLFEPPLGLFCPLSIHNILTFTLYLFIPTSRQLNRCARSASTRKLPTR
tara:strand:- start:337 stop:864 length:528 start_codon:yes stop_codon:yes gene_type:complete